MIAIKMTTDFLSESFFMGTLFLIKKPNHQIPKMHAKGKAETLVKQAKPNIKSIQRLFFTSFSPWKTLTKK